MQKYTEISQDEGLLNSLAMILDNDKTALSCSSGVAFPTDDVQIGQLCFRTDENRLYQTKDGVSWVEVADLSKSFTQHIEAINSAIALRAPIASPTLTGVPKAPTAAAGNNSTQIATTAFVSSAVSAAISEIMGGAPSAALDTLYELGKALGDDANFAATMTQALATKLNLSGGTLTGSITAPSFVGALTGNAATATKLATARTINGVAFDGSANITIVDSTKLPLTGGTMSGSLRIEGAAGANPLQTRGIQGIANGAAAAGLYLNYVDQTVKTYFNGETHYIQGGVYTGNAATATKLQTARTINGVSFDGSANITIADSTKLPLAGGTVTGALTVNGLITAGASGIKTAKIDSTSAVGFLNGGSAQNIHTGGVLVSNAYADSTKIPTNGIYSKGKIHTATSVEVGSSVDGAKDTDYVRATIHPPTHTGGDWEHTVRDDATYAYYKLRYGAAYGYLQLRSDGVLSASGGFDGNASTATKLATARTIALSGAATGTATSFDGSANISIAVTSLDAAKLSGTASISTTGNAGTATKLATARTIGGVSFDGSANINLPGVNTVGNQNTSGNAGTATKLQTARAINGVAFDGSGNITIGEPTFANPLASHSSGDANALNTGGFNVRFLRSAAANKPAGFDHAVMTLNYAHDWSAQQAFDWRTGDVFTRTQSNGTWLDWATQVDTRNYAKTIPTFSVNGVGLVPARVGTTTTKFLREDGTWVVPTNTTYGGMTAAEITAGTATTNRLISPVNLKTAIQTWAPTPTSVSGNAGTATKLATAVTINGVSFDGSASITLPTFTTDVAGLVPARSGTTTTKFLREDGTWVVPTDTTYSPMSQSEAETGTATTGRVVTAAVLKSAIQTHAPTPTSVTGNAGTATKLATARTINGTSFNGSANITTANWGTARTLTIGNSAKSVNGSANVSWTLAEIGAAAASHTHDYLPTSGGWVTGSLAAGVGLGVINTLADTGYGLSLYGGAVSGMPGYGISFAGTTTWGGHGSVADNDWATYFTMSGATSRGWIFKSGNAAGGNVASISASGDIAASGSITASGNVTAYSDKRIKEDVAVIEDALAKVEQLSGVTFKRKDTLERQTGLLAQDVEAVLPEAVTRQVASEAVKAITGDDEVLAVNYGAITGLLVESIKALSDQVKAQQKLIETLLNK